MKLSYEDAVSESQKTRIPHNESGFAQNQDLKIEMDANSIDSEKISSLFEKVSSQRGIRYAVAEPIDLIIQSPESIIRV